MNMKLHPAVVKLFRSKKPQDDTDDDFILELIECQRILKDLNIAALLHNGKYVQVTPLTQEELKEIEEVKHREFIQMFGSGL